MPGANGGQIVEDFLREEGFNVHRVSPPRAQHARRKMKVLAANVKVPQQPSAQALKMEMTNKIEDKQILTDEPCHETMVERFVVSENGSIQKEEVKVEGRIIPTMDLRWRILQDHEDKHLMRCHPSTYSAYSTMERCQLEKELSAMGEEVFDEATQPELADRLYRYHHTRHLFLSNDHADVAGASYI